MIGSIYALITLWLVDQNSPIFSLNVSRVLVDHLLFWLSSCQLVPDIRDRNRKLSEIMPNIWRFCPFKFYGRRNLQKLYPNYYACLVLWGYSY